MKPSPAIRFQIPYWLRGWSRKLIGGGPVFVTFFVTSDCNGSCPHCLQAGKPNASEPPLNPAEVERIARSFPSFGNLLVSGGEPFLRGDLSEVIQPFYRHCRVRQITVPTNGSLPERIESMSQAIARSCPSAKVNIRISLDGPPDLHDEIRGIPGGFELAMESARRLQRLQDALSNLWLEFCTTLSARNHDSYEALLAELDARSIRQTPYVILCRKPTREEGLWQLPMVSYQAAQRAFRKRFLRSSPDSHSLLFERVILAYTRMTEKRIVRVLSNPEYRWRCSAGRLSLIIDEVGAVYPCETIWRKLGSLREEDYDVKQILGGESLHRFREEIRSGCRCTHETCVTTDVSFSARALVEIAGGLLWNSSPGRLRDHT